VSLPVVEPVLTAIPFEEALKQTAEQAGEVLALYQEMEAIETRLRKLSQILSESYLPFLSTSQVIQQQAVENAADSSSEVSSGKEPSTNGKEILTETRITLPLTADQVVVQFEQGMEALWPVWLTGLMGMVEEIKLEIMQLHDHLLEPGQTWTGSFARTVRGFEHGFSVLQEQVENGEDFQYRQVAKILNAWSQTLPSLMELLQAHRQDLFHGAFVNHELYRLFGQQLLEEEGMDLELSKTSSLSEQDQVDTLLQALQQAQERFARMTDEIFPSASEYDQSTIIQVINLLLRHQRLLGTWQHFRRPLGDGSLPVVKAHELQQIVDFPYDSMRVALETVADSPAKISFLTQLEEHQALTEELASPEDPESLSEEQLQSAYPQLMHLLDDAQAIVPQLEARSEEEESFSVLEVLNLLVSVQAQINGVDKVDLDDE